MRTSARVLYVAFMGSGKTVAGAAVIRHVLDEDPKEKVLVLTHRKTILDQTDRKLVDAGIPREWISIIRRDDSRFDAAARVQLASIDTLLRRDMPVGITRIVIDEAHHAPAGKWQRVLAHYKGVPVFGLTATPIRLDGKPLGETFDVMVESDPVSPTWPT